MIIGGIITSDFRETVSYNPSYKVEKEVVYFLAETEQVDVIPRPGEIENVRWVSVDQALDVLTHENDKRVFKEALAEVESKYLLAYQN